MVRNARGKINRTQKNYGIDLTSNVPIPSINEFATRQEFNDWKSQIKSFTNRANLKYQFQKNEHGFVATKKEVRFIEKHNKQSIENATKEIARIENKDYYVSGKRVGKLKEYYSQFADNPIGITIPNKFEFKNIKNRSQLNYWKESVKKKSDTGYYGRRMSDMQKNFIEMMEFTYNSEADSVVEKLRNLPADDFYDIYLQFPDVFDFKLYASKGSRNETVHEGNLRKIETYLDQYYNGELDQDLKGF